MKIFIQITYIMAFVCYSMLNQPVFAHDPKASIMPGGVYYSVASDSVNAGAKAILSQLLTDNKAVISSSTIDLHAKIVESVNRHPAARNTGTR